jgi:hypothetical protein
MLTFYFNYFIYKYNSPKALIIIFFKHSLLPLDEF